MGHALVWWKGYLPKYHLICLIALDTLAHVQLKEDTALFEDIAIHMAVVFVGQNSTGTGRKLSVCGTMAVTPERMNGTRSFEWYALTLVWNYSGTLGEVFSIYCFPTWLDAPKIPKYIKWTRLHVYKLKIIYQHIFDSYFFQHICNVNSDLFVSIPLKLNSKLGNLIYIKRQFFCNMWPLAPRVSSEPGGL